MPDVPDLLEPRHSLRNASVVHDTQARDLRLLDALPASSPPAILCRDRAIVVNLEFIKCIITTGAQRCMRLATRTPQHVTRSDVCVMRTVLKYCQPWRSNQASHSMCRLWLGHPAGYALLLDSGEPKMASFVEELQRRLRVRPSLVHRVPPAMPDCWNCHCLEGLACVARALMLGCGRDCRCASQSKSGSSV